MNQQLYRIVFNKARGCLMAVAETATAQGKTGERRSGGRSVRADRGNSGTHHAGVLLAAGLHSLQPLALALASVLFLVSITPDVQAQIVADPGAPSSQRATVLTTGSGNNIPLVNIQTPSAAGVSRNTYSQFDVTGAGAVLNNSRTNVQTQLGGWVQGNPWLATGGARVILNEVNSSNPSQLRGAIEIAGQRAEVIVANPAGIQVDGASFINTSRATLTTGTPIVTNGSLDGYRVERGTVNISGAGLDARSTDSTAILARAIEVNAGIWANQLTVTTGANAISADLANTTAIPGTGTTPAFALDVAAIGGMYAGKITLVGTEAGLGVRNAGVVQANAGDLVLNANGWLSNTGSLSASQNLDVQTHGTVSNSGTLYSSGANGQTAVTANGSTGSISNTGLIGAQGDTSLSSSGAVNSASGSVLAAGLATDGTVGSSGSLVVTASTGATLNGQSVAGADARVTATAINVSSGQLSGRNLNLTASSGDMNATGASLVASQTLTASTPQTLRTDAAVLSANQLTLTALGLSNVGGQLLQAGAGDLSLNFAGNLDNRSGTIATNGSILVGTSTLNNGQGRITANQNATLSTTAGVDNTDGAVSAALDLHLAGGNLTNTRGTLQASSGNATLVVADLSNSSGSVMAGGNLSIQAVNVNNSGSLYAAGRQTLAATGALNNSGVIAALGDTTATAQSVSSTSSSLLAAGLKADGSLGSSGDLSVTAVQTLATYGQSIAARALHLDGASVDLSGSQTSATNLILRANAGDINASHATLSATQTLVASSSQTLRTDAAVVSAQQLNLTALALSNVGGQVLQTGTGGLALQFAGTLDNTQGVIASNSQNLTLSAQTLGNADGRIEHAGSGTLSIQAYGLDGQRGQIASNGALTLVSGAVHLEAATTSAEQITITASSLDNQDGHTIQTGTADTRITLSGEIDNTRGVLASNGNTTLSARTLVNQAGTVQAAGLANLAITTTAGLDNRSGQLLAGGALTLHADTLDNIQGHATAGDTLTATVAGRLNNTDGLLAANQALSLTAASLDNTRGSVASVLDNLDVATSGTTTSDHGRIAAAGGVSLNNTGFSNTSGSTTGRNVSLDTHGQRLDNTAGTLAATRSASLQTGALNNDGGLIQAGTTLSIDTQGQALTNTNAARYTGAAGGISAQATLTLETGVVNNAAGYIGAGGAMAASTGQVSNTAAGQIVGRSSISFVSTGFDNRGGQVQALGDVSIDAGAGSINNTTSLLRSAATLSLNAGSVINSGTNGTLSQGLASNQGMEGYNVAITANTVANDTGAIRADNNTTLTSSGSIDNTNGLISAGNMLALQDAASTKTLAITNTGGTQIAARSLGMVAATLTGGGQLLSRGNLSMALTSDIDNTSQIIASGNASISTTGNIINSGTLQAGNTLTLSANNIDNTATGEISAITTRVTASNTLTNRGLIDGTDTQINAGTLNNIGTGRIYGDHASIAAGTVNNDAEAVNGITSAATIAARNRLDIGANTINNSNGALMFSLGDMAIGGSLDANRLATGSASTVTNSASTVQAMGSLRMATAELNNLNPGFAYTLSTDATGASKADYIAADGTIYTPADFAWVSNGLAYQSPTYIRQRWVASINGGESLASPYANTLFEAFYSGPDAYVAPYTYRSGGGHDAQYTTLQATYAYDKTSSIWSTFGVTPPTTDIPVNPGITCTGSGRQETCSDPTEAQLAAFNVYIQPWVALQTKIDAFRAVAKTYIQSFQTYREYTETGQSAAVTASTPGQILSGGGLEINASQSLLNDNSQILAGGALSIGGAAVNNRATQVTTTTVRNGNIKSWGVVDEDCSLFGCDPVYGWNSGAYTQNTASTLTLGTSVTLGNTASNARTTVTNLSPVAAVTGVQSASNVDVALIGTVNAGNSTMVAAIARNGANSVASVNASATSAVPRITLVTSASGGAVHSTTPDTRIPSASLFHTAPSFTSHYLIETDPRFTNAKQWLSSDALLAALSYDPVTVQKRLGDGFYEQQLIREQVAKLTGNRFLDNYSSDETQYQALITSGVTYAKAWNLVPGIALSAEQMAQLTSDMVWLVEQTITLADGSTQKVLLPQLYAMVRDGDLSNSGALLSGGSVNLNLSGDLGNSGTIAGRSVVALTADNVENLGGRITGTDVAVQASTDLNSIGGQISASNSLLATAGRDINIVSTSQSSRTATGSTTGIDRIAGLYVTGPNGALMVSAGRDANLSGAIVSSSGSAALLATNNLNLQALTQAEGVNATRDADNYIRFNQSQSVGTTVQATQALTLSAGKDLTAVAASINSTGGATTLAAGENVNLLAGRNTTSQATASFVEGSGSFNSGSTRTRNSTNTDKAQGSTVGGNTVTVLAGNNIQVSGSNVVSDAGTVLVAKNDIAITSASNTRTDSNFFETKTSGFSADGGFNWGNNQQSTDGQSQGSNASASTVAALGGDVLITAGNRYTQVGSTVQAAGMPTAGMASPIGNGDISIQAKDIAITEARESSASSTVTKQSSSGFTLAVTSPMISAMESVTQMADASGKTSDKRMKTLAAANIGLTAYNAVQDATQSGGPSGINVSLSYGKSSSTSTIADQSNTAAGSSVIASGNLSIVAKGTTDADKASGHTRDTLGNILVQGSTLRAADTTTLQADNTILLQAAQNTSSEQSSSKSSSSSVSLSYGTGGWSVSASASQSKSKGEGADLLYTNTEVSGGKAVQLSSGGDTTLRGATITALTVTADVGSNLSIQSLQDQSSYHSSSSSSSASGTIGGGGSVSGSVSRTKVESEFLSVGTQSGIKAGDGGFQVAVQGNTTLTGGAITSSQAAIDAGKNSLTTATLAINDLKNVAQANTSSSGFSLSSDMLSQGKYGLAKSVIGNALNNGEASSASSGMTRSAVSAGAVTIMDEAQQIALTGQTAVETVASLNRDTAIAQTAAQKQNSQAMLRTAQAEQAIKNETFRQVTIHTDAAYNALFKADTQFYKVICSSAPEDCIKDPRKVTMQPITQEEAKHNGSVLAVNGIFNDTDRAGQLAYQNAPTTRDPETLEEIKPNSMTLMHITPASTNLGELLVAGYEKLLAPVLGYSNADMTYADSLQGRGNEPTLSVGHSRGTIVQTNALNIAADNGYVNLNLTVLGVGGAVKEQTYVNAATRVTQTPKNTTFTYMANDPISVIAAGNSGDAWAALKEFYNVYLSSNSAHSCYGTGAKDCSTIASPVAGGPTPLNQQSQNLVTYRGGVLVTPLQESK